MFHASRSIRHVSTRSARDTPPGMRSAEAGRVLQQLARELDLVVFRLEQAARSNDPIPPSERTGLQGDLETLRDRIESVALDLVQQEG